MQTLWPFLLRFPRDRIAVVDAVCMVRRDSGGGQHTGASHASGDCRCPVLRGFRLLAPQEHYGSAGPGRSSKGGASIYSQASPYAVGAYPATQLRGRLHAAGRQACRYDYTLCADGLLCWAALQNPWDEDYSLRRRWNVTDEGMAGMGVPTDIGGRCAGWGHFCFVFRERGAGASRAGA